MATIRDEVRTDVIVNAKAAIHSLQEMSAAARSNEERIAKFSSFLVAKSKEWNIPLSKLLSTFKQINAELSKQHKANIFGNVGGADIFKGATGFLNAAQAAERFKVSADGVVQSVGKTGDAMDKAGQKATGWKHKIDLVRTALGTLAAMLVFQVISAITTTFQTAIDNAKQLELSLYRLNNLEKTLSMEGVEISMKGLKDGIAEIQKLLPIFSKEDITQLVGALGLATKELGLSEAQLLDLAKAVAILNVNSVNTETLLETQGHVVSSLLTNNAKGVSQLGLSFGNVKMAAKAAELGIIQVGDSIAKLTEQEKTQIKFAIIMETAGIGDAAKELENVAAILDTNAAKLEENKAAWNDLLTNLGQIILPFIPVLTGGFKAIVLSLDAMKIAIIQLLGVVGGAGVAIMALLKGEIKSFEDFANYAVEGFIGVRNKMIKEFFKDVPALLPEGWADIIRQEKETETGAEDLQEAFDAIDTEKASDALEDLLKDLEALGKKLEETERDFQTKLTRFDEDALEDRERLIEDYNLNVEQTLRGFALRRQELEQKYRQNELDKEAKFQEQLRQLREKFLYNLEDALRERDARQVLRLIDQYNMDKTAMVNEHNLERQLQQQQHQEELNDLKEQEAERLRVMAEEQAVRLQRQEEDSSLRRSRMLEDHAQEIADLMAQKEEILREAADKIAKEYDLNAQGAEAIYDLLNKYYGGDGILEKLVADGYRGMLEQSAGFLAQLQEIIAMQQGLMSMGMGYQPIAITGGGHLTGGNTGGGSGGTGGSKGGRSGNRSVGLADGGQFVATRPTRLNVGEGGIPEIVSVIPLAKLLSGSLGINGSGGSNGINGKIEVAVSLSEGLEASIVNKAMDSVGEVVSRVNRSKV